MTCNDAQSILYVYLDGELAGPDAREFERHVGGCVSCRAHLQEEARFLDMLRENVPPASAPEALRHRIEAAIAARPLRGVSGPRSTGSTNLAWAMPVAIAAAALLAVGVYAGRSLAPTGDPGVRAAVAVFEDGGPMEVSGTAQHIRKYLEERARFPVHIPEPSDPNVRLVGARMTDFDGSPGVRFDYTLGDHRFSVLQRPQGHPLRGGSHGHARVDAHGPYKVITWRAHGVTNSAVTRGGDGDVRHILPAGFRP